MGRKKGPHNENCTCISCKSKRGEYIHKIDCTCCSCKSKQGLNTGKNHPNFGRRGEGVTSYGNHWKWSNDSKQKLKITIQNNGGYKGKNNPMFGRKHKEETLRKQSLAAGGSGTPGEISDYGPYWTDELKESIRNRDNYICQLCNMTEEEHLMIYGSVLPVHHIDYNKKNCVKENLISLCFGCNTRVNHNRKYWIEYFIKNFLESWEK